MKTIITCLLSFIATSCCLAQEAPRSIVSLQAEFHKVDLEWHAETTMETDVMYLEEFYRDNNFTFDLSDSIVLSFLREIFDEFKKVPDWKQKSFGELDYIGAKSKVFTKIVMLNIHSEPEGATVRIKEPLTDLGNTKVVKPFESEKEYKFVFEMEGHQSEETSYKIAPYPKTQTIKTKLKKKL